MSLTNIQGKLSRAEMKQIMAGSGGGCVCTTKSDCASTACSKAGAKCYSYNGSNV